MLYLVILAVSSKAPVKGNVKRMWGKFISVEAFIHKLEELRLIVSQPVFETPIGVKERHLFIFLSHGFSSVFAGAFVSLTPSVMPQKRGRVRIF